LIPRAKTHVGKAEAEREAIMQAGRGQACDSIRVERADETGSMVRRSELFGCPDPRAVPGRANY